MSFIFLSFLILLVGMFKPKWILFWMDNPTRIMIAAASTVFFMGGAVLFGEGNKQKQLELQKQASVVKSGQAVDDKPEQVKPVTPPPPPPPPAQAPTTSANDLRP